MFKKLVYSWIILALLQIIVGILIVCAKFELYSQLKYVGFIWIGFACWILITYPIFKIKNKLKNFDWYFIVVCINSLLIIGTCWINIFAIIISIFWISSIIAFLIRRIYIGKSI